MISMRTLGAIALAAVAVAGCGGGEAIEAGAKALARSDAAAPLERDAAAAATTRSLEVASERSPAQADLTPPGTVVDQAASDPTVHVAARRVEVLSAEVAASSEADSVIRRCARGAIEETARAYVEDYTAGDESPDVGGVLDSSFKGCLGEAYPTAAQVVEALTTVFHSTIADASRDEVDSGATPQEYVDWLAAVASAIGLEPQ
jgi:hypothetical protein